jgi:hypothetical protein
MSRAESKGLLCFWGVMEDLLRSYRRNDLPTRDQSAYIPDGLTASHRIHRSAMRGPGLCLTGTRIDRLVDEWSLTKLQNVFAIMISIVPSQLIPS